MKMSILYVSNFLNVGEMKSCFLKKETGRFYDIYVVSMSFDNY